METGKIIRRFFFVTTWVVIGGGMLMLLIAAIGKKNRELCSDYLITIKGAERHLFVNKNDIENLVRRQCGGRIEGKSISSFDLLQMETVLEKNNWINDAELYFDNRGVLHINIKEREPIARVFRLNGQSFYIDSSARQMPLSEKLSARVPVFTGFPDNKSLRKKDSVLLNDISKTAQFIFDDPFWMAQVSQVNITASRQFEISPSIGNHKIIFGNADNIAAKFNRLQLFYKQVMAKTGMDAYGLIDVRFNGQVVATKQARQDKIDSVQLRRNVEKLLSNPNLMKTDSVSLPAINDPYIKTTNNN
jgi:cell division protein FtsQ